MKKKTVIVNDKMQINYRYELTEPVGRNFHPDFRPELAPKQMLALGVFGGKHMTDCKKELQKEGFNLPSDAKTGGTSLGLRQPENITRTICLIKQTCPPAGRALASA